MSQKVEFGTPEKGIVETAKTEGVDLIIVATHGRGWSLAYVFGKRNGTSDSKRSMYGLAIPPGLAETGEDLYSPAVRAFHPRKKHVESVR
jgi:hypothetical protein